ncbi:hypothetical protein C8Q75DRAFT_736305 [Abortiporus biennis]|nr:hypothetical protein C8Q75DRAFT_736305 [Abortiporus biennis]
MSLKRFSSILSRKSSARSTAGSSTGDRLQYSSKSLVKNTALWFDDGTIVLQAQNVLYRVYAGHLARYSKVFTDMLAIPQSSDSEDDSLEKYEGVPLVFLPDSSFDTTNFLMALLHPGFHGRLESLKIEELASILRLSRKYIVDILLSQVVGILTQLFPSTLSTHIKISNEVRLANATTGQLFTIANIAKETGVDILLPSIYYRCCQLELSKVMEDAQTLDPENLNRIITGRDKLQTLTLHSFSWLFAEETRNSKKYARLESESCRDWDCTREAEVAKVAKTASTTTSSGLNMLLDPLCLMLLCKAIPTTTCEGCRGGISRLATTSALNVWTNLPQTFGLPEWKKLVRK